MNYVTLHQVKEQLKITNSTDDNIFLNWIAWSSELIDWWKGRRFDIYRDTIRLDTPKQTNLKLGEYYGGEYTAVEQLFQKDLYLKTSHFDLIAIEELLNGDETEITASQYMTEPANKPYINRIWLKRGSSLIWLPDADNETMQAIELTGYFGYNKKYPVCFVDTGEDITSDAGLLANETLLQVSDVTQAAKDFLKPKIQIGNMLRFVSENGAEFCLVENIESDDYGFVLTLQRGYNGTVAVAHPKDTSLFVYRVDGDILQMAIRLVQWRYRQKDQDSFDRTYNLATQTVTSPTSLPSDVRTILGTRKADM